MKLISSIAAMGAVSFPAFMAERVYMREFRKANGLPSDLEHWQPTVDTMLEGVDTDGPIYLMVDSGFVKAGEAQRRRGLHIDGYWNPTLNAHGTGGGEGSHRGKPGYSGHDSTPVGGHRGGRIGDGGTPNRHGPYTGRHAAGPVSWGEADFSVPEGLILASSVSAARGFVGEFQGPIGEGGDCSHVDLSPLAVLPMEANTVYAGNVTCLHESIPVVEDCYRQLVRLNVPGWTI